MDSHLTPIPEEFYSFESNQPFENCLVCKADLLSGEIEYFIEKAVRNYHEHDVSDIVYEYAICWHCAHDMNSQMSAESMQNIQDYFSDQSMFMQNLNDYNNNWQEKEGELIPDKCVITGEVKADMDEFGRK